MSLLNLIRVTSLPPLSKETLKEKKFTLRYTIPLGALRKVTGKELLLCLCKE